MMKKFSLLIAILFGTGLMACQGVPQPPSPIFNYATTQSVQIQINARAAGEPVKGAMFVIYQSVQTLDLGGVLQDVGDKEVQRGFTNSSGLYKQEVILPADLNKVYIQVNSIGLTNELLELPIQNKAVSLLLDDQKVNQLSIASHQKNSLTPQFLPSDTVLRYLGDYTKGSTGGVPNYFTSNQIISADTLRTINASLPEGIQLPNNPSLKNYIARGAASNLVFSQAGEAWMTFIHEGAGYKNSVGYYLYDAANPPSSVHDIKNRMIVALPNASFTNAGGGLSTGKRIKLRYFDPNLPTAQQWSDTFPAGTGVGWFLLANGWNGTIALERNPQQTVFSDQAINYQLYKNNANMTVEKSAQTVLLDNGTDSEGRKSLLLGIEDILRYQGGDQDFNDAILLIQANPPEAVASTVAVRDPEITDTIRSYPLSPVNTQTPDSDGDGVNDLFDQYPNDPSKALNSYFPAKNDFGTLLFEDLWPKRGDYDFNDMVIDYNVIHVTNAANQVVQIIGEYTVKALGGGFHNGFAFQTNLLPNQVASVNYAWEKDGVVQSGRPPRYGTITYNPNGLESGQNKATVIVFEDGYDITPPSLIERPFYSNVVDNEPIKTPGKIRVTIDLTAPVAASAIGAVPYNPFIVVNPVGYVDGTFVINRIRGLEVHLPGFAPSNKADTTLFGTQDDTSDAAQGRYYQDNDNRPWALHLPTRFTHLKERLDQTFGWVSLGEDIRTGYIQFDPWALSEGIQSKDWYRDLPNYRNISKLYAGTLP
jgi:LruC domain-containing protein